MNKEDVLLKNYSVLSKNPRKNAKSIQSLIGQLCELNPKLAMRCWQDILQENIDEILDDIDSDGSFQYDSLGYRLVDDFADDLINEGFFKYAVEDFAKSRQLLEILYSRCPISEYTRVYYPIAYAIRNHKLSAADAILSAIYKNNTFHGYADLWKDIIDRFRYTDLDNYCGGGWVDDDNYKQPADVQEFCMNWAERIPDDEEQAAAITFVLRIM